MSKSSLYPFPHYLVLDTNVVLDQVHVFEEDVLCDIIVLHTVLDEVKHKSNLVYKKFRDILGDKSRNFYIFVNEHHKWDSYFFFIWIVYLIIFYRDTYVERVAGETANDRNDRAIRVATKWYDEHLGKLKKTGVRPVLLTDDVGNRNKALAEGILACSGIARWL